MPNQKVERDTREKINLRQVYELDKPQSVVISFWMHMRYVRQLWRVERTKLIVGAEDLSLVYPQRLELRSKIMQGSTTDLCTLSLDVSAVSLTVLLCPIGMFIWSPSPPLQLSGPSDTLHYILGTCCQSEFPPDQLVLSIQTFLPILPMELHGISSWTVSSSLVWENN